MQCDANKNIDEDVCGCARPARPITSVPVHFASSFFVRRTKDCVHFGLFAAFVLFMLLVCSLFRSCPNAWRLCAVCVCVCSMSQTRGRRTKRDETPQNFESKQETAEIAAWLRCWMLEKSVRTSFGASASQRANISHVMLTDHTLEHAHAHTPRALHTISCCIFYWCARIHFDGSAMGTGCCKYMCERTAAILRT